MDTLIRILVSLFLAVSLIGAGPAMTRSAAVQETLAIESAPEFPVRVGEYVTGRCSETFPCLSRWAVPAVSHGWKGDQFNDVQS